MRERPTLLLRVGRAYTFLGTMLLLLLACVAVVAWSNLDSAKRSDEIFQDPRVTVQYYDVEGNSFEAIERSMREHGPVDKHGVHRYAHTGWHISWKWPKRRGVNDFRATEVTCTVNVLLPRLVKESHLTPAIRAEWRRFMQAMIAHEWQHARHALDNYQSITARIAEASAKNQDLNESDAEAIAQKVLASIRLLDLELDRESIYGKKQGVELLHPL